MRGVRRNTTFPALTWYSHNCAEKTMNANAFNRSCSFTKSPLVLCHLERVDQNVHGGAVWTQRGFATFMIAQMRRRVEGTNTSHAGNAVHDALLTRLRSLSTGGPTAVKPPDAGSKPPEAGVKPPRLPHANLRSYCSIKPFVALQEPEKNSQN